MSSSPELRLYNTLTRKKERFEPIDGQNVRVYACGPTVYDHLHIGNGRMLVVFDVLFRVLRHLYGADHVTYVRNITDVDDKINARAAERGISIGELTREMTEIFHADAKALGCLTATAEPRATDYIGPMLEIIGKLIERGHAYAADGHVLFDVPSDADYGKLSRRPLDEMIAGARVEVAPYKRAPTDFVLWKPSAPGEPAWDSPWGRGRPGWHLECSAMSWKHLGEVFDIHGGGIDLVFPHHENEIAQTCCAFGTEVMANYWMHNGHLQVEGEKMSKSLGNFVTIHDLLHTDKFGGRSWPGEVLRLALLMTAYRHPLDWTVLRLREALKMLDMWMRVARDALAGPLFDPKTRVAYSRSEFIKNLKPSLDMISLLSDDLNAAAVAAHFAALFNTTGPGRRLAHQELAGDLLFLGLTSQEELERDHIETQRLGVSEQLHKRVEALTKERLAARAAKNWQESDRIRDELAAMGIALKDNKDGTTTWEVKR